MLSILGALHVHVMCDSLRDWIQPVTRHYKYGPQVVGKRTPVCPTVEDGFASSQIERERAAAAAGSGEKWPFFGRPATSAI